MPLMPWATHLLQWTGQRVAIDLAREGNEIIREAAKWSPELAAACEVWKAIISKKVDKLGGYVNDILCFPSLRHV